ncbi:c-type cytochrome biogenesis protein CcsB [Polycladomyces sp. WAk]|uniref:C-type cytochrome biogenesis protein CcsB n=1 Tax=Polycladomyces zharkentensis TaxID=2807616 RepID=A0ABS2WK14_9BACL|nr:c-type cytochrome biogenesis protein CcsB [Polycladomyces sp. WAk]MBN2909734.1 c-type cytochrome biogenesis protein CcsB [Polycladomyces sp. WAk]
MVWEKVMENLLLCTFFLYVLASVVFVIAIVGKKWSTGEEVHVRRWSRLGIMLTIVGVLFQVMFIITRIIIGGHFPTSNMFEFASFLSFTIVLAFIVIFYMYRTVVLGAFAMPIAVIMLAYASVFPREVEPLIPALQSYWLFIHVTTTALGEGAFIVGFVAGLIYLIGAVGHERGTTGAAVLEGTLLLLVMLIGFILTSFAFSMAGYHAEIQHTFEGQQLVQVYEMPPIVGPNGGEVLRMQPFLGMTQPLFEAPSWMQGQEAARKFNSVIWSVLSGLVLYGLIRLAARRRISELLYPMVKNISLEIADEISYRAIAIGFPIFTLGGLIFAMIWAQEAWGRFWGWDPKEVWALITWLFYSAYLHLRLSRGWHGLKSSWMAVIGFVIIMLNLIVINLVIAGLHSYA